jgi:hypothetical protein
MVAEQKLFLPFQNYNRKIKRQQVKERLTIFQFQSYYSENLFSKSSAASNAVATWVT